MSVYSPCKRSSSAARVRESTLTCARAHDAPWAARSAQATAQHSSATAQGTQAWGPGQRAARPPDLPAQLLEHDVDDRLLDHDRLRFAQLGEREPWLGRFHRRERVQQHRELRVDMRVVHRRYLRVRR
jgi:hypothetical protein